MPLSDFGLGSGGVLIKGGRKREAGVMMYDHGGWMGGCGGIGMLLFSAILIVGIVFLVRHLTARGPTRAGEDAPLDILKRRYARGEISREEFERMRKDLSE